MQPPRTPCGPAATQWVDRAQLRPRLPQEILAGDRLPGGGHPRPDAGRLLPAHSAAAGGHRRPRSSARRPGSPRSGAVYAGATGAAAQAAATAAAAAAAASQVAYGGTIDGSVIFGNLCTGCHTSGAGGAPTLDKAHWAARLAQGKDTLHKHAIEGYTGTAGVMPAKGGNPALTDEQVDRHRRLDARPTSSKRVAASSRRRTPPAGGVVVCRALTRAPPAYRHAPVSCRAWPHPHVSPTPRSRRPLTAARRPRRRAGGRGRPQRRPRRCRWSRSSAIRCRPKAARMHNKVVTMAARALRELGAGHRALQFPRRRRLRRQLRRGRRRGRRPARGRRLGARAAPGRGAVAGRLQLRRLRVAADGRASCSRRC